MFYKDNAEEVFARFRELFTGGGHDKIYAKMVLAQKKEERAAPGEPKHDGEADTPR